MSGRVLAVGRGWRGQLRGRERGACLHGRAGVGAGGRCAGHGSSREWRANLTPLADLGGRISSGKTPRPPGRGVLAGLKRALFSDPRGRRSRALLWLRRGRGFSTSATASHGSNSEPTTIGEGVGRLGDGEEAAGETTGGGTGGAQVGAALARVAVAAEEPQGEAAEVGHVAEGGRHPGTKEGADPPAVASDDEGEDD